MILNGTIGEAKTTKNVGMSEINGLRLVEISTEGFQLVTSPKIGESNRIKGLRPLSDYGQSNRLAGGRADWRGS